MTLSRKAQSLCNRLISLDRPAVSLSGGVDSQLLLAMATDTLGAENVLAVTARGVNFPEHEIEAAIGFAKRLGVRHVLVDFDPMAVPEFVENCSERCYYCKKALFTQIADAARRNGAGVLADGANLDDTGDHRPGMRAARELGVVSPLLEAELKKADIRTLLREKGIPDWDKPSFACLATRVPYGTPITVEELQRIGKAEGYLAGRGLRTVRVRVHGAVARVEVAPEERKRFYDARFMDEVGTELQKYGFSHAALDFLGYRSGSMNEGL